MPFFWGNPICPLLPKRVPVHSVVGKPIPMPSPKSSPFSEEEVHATHAKYVEAVKELFEAHKGKWGYSKLQLELV